MAGGGGALAYMAGGPLSALVCGAGGCCAVNATGGTACSGGDGALAPECDARSSVNVPPRCFGLRATAADAGRAEGVSVGDVLEVAFSRASGSCTDGSAAGGAVALSAGINASAAWVSGPRIARYTVGGTGNVSVDGSSIGVLTASPAASGECVGPLPGALAALVGGSWGPHQAPRLLSAVANDTGAAPGLSVGDTVILTFDLETDRPPVGATGMFSTALGTTAAVWLDARRLRVLVLGVEPSARPEQTRVGVLSARVAPSLRILSRDRSSPPANASLGVSGGWGTGIARVAGAAVGSLSTAGGDSVVFYLAAPLGPGTAGLPVRVVCSDGARSFAAAGCAFDDGGAFVTCLSAPGVGADLQVCALVCWCRLWCLVRPALRALFVPLLMYATL